MSETKRTKGPAEGDLEDSGGSDSMTREARALAAVLGLPTDAINYGALMLAARVCLAGNAARIRGLEAERYAALRIIERERAESDRRGREVVAWKAHVELVALELKCLPSNFPDSNEHVLSALSALLAANARLAETLRDRMDEAEPLSGSPKAPMPGWVDRCQKLLADPSTASALKWLEEQKRAAVREALTDLAEQIEEAHRDCLPEPHEGESAGYEARGTGIVLEVVQEALAALAEAKEG